MIETEVAVKAFIRRIKSKKHRAERVDAWLTALRLMANEKDVIPFDVLARDEKLLCGDLVRVVLGEACSENYARLYGEPSSRILEAICDAYDCPPTGMVWERRRL